MPLPVLNWRYVGTLSFTAGSQTSANAALYSLGTSSTYYNGEARTPGTGSAWTWQQDDTSTPGSVAAVWGTPPVNALNMKYIIGGIAGSNPYTAAGPDGKLSGGIVVGMAQNAGNYTVWSSATPFTSGYFTQYWQATGPLTTRGYNRIRLWESEEACFVQWSGASNASTVSLGALFDPLVYVSGRTCQSDNRLYFWHTTGGVATTDTDWMQQPRFYSGLVPASDTNAGDAHTGVILPSTGTWDWIYSRVGTRPDNNDALNQLTDSYVTRGGEIVVMPLSVTSTGFMGTSRQFGYCRAAATGSVWQSGGVDRGYVIAAKTGTSDAIMLVRV